MRVKFVARELFTFGKGTCFGVISDLAKGIIVRAFDNRTKRIRGKAGTPQMIGMDREDLRRAGADRADHCYGNSNSFDRDRTFNGTARFCGFGV